MVGWLSFPLRQRLDQLRERLAQDSRCQQVLTGSWESDRGLSVRAAAAGD